MSRNKTRISFSKPKKNYLQVTKTGYSLNKNGKPLLLEGKYDLQSNVGRYRPTPHNISDI